jgi:phage repressor protein C with HTH and peptisase S24 domain
MGVVVMSFSQRLALKIKEHRFNNATLAKEIGVSRPSIGNWLNEASAPEGKHLFALSKALNVSVNWLLTGETEIIQVQGWDNSTPLDADEVEVVFYKDYLASCGSGSYSEASSSETRRLRMSKTTLRNTGILKPFAITATGDSMQPVITDGATVFIDGGRTTVKDGKIYFVTYGGLAKIKYLYALPNNGLRMKSANPDFSDETLSADDIKQLNLIVQGQVFSVSQMFGL